MTYTQEELGSADHALYPAEPTLPEKQRIAELETAASYNQDVMRVMSEKLNRQAERITQLKESNFALQRQVRHAKITNFVLLTFLIIAVMTIVFMPTFFAGM